MVLTISIRFPLIAAMAFVVVFVASSMLSQSSGPRSSWRCLWSAEGWGERHSNGVASDKGASEIRMSLSLVRDTDRWDVRVVDAAGFATRQHSGVAWQGV